jgi:TolB-like protein/Tfp pilus assembly protein PilF
VADVKLSRIAVALAAYLVCSVHPVWTQCPDGAPPPCGRGAARSGAQPAPTSVAVLYFDNISRDTSDAYLAEGLTEELITRLGQVPRLAVKSRNAVRRFRGEAAGDPTAVGRALGVAHLVSGTVRRQGDRLRVTAELTRAATGVRVWGDVLERTDADLMSVEAQIASAIATAIAGRLAPSERQSLAARPTVNPEAYDHLLRGDFHLARRTGPEAHRALAEYEAAVRLDPAFARAWARIGLAYELFVDWSWPFPGLTWDSLLARGFTASDRALALDSANADAWSARGLLLSYRDPATQAGSVEALQRAVHLDPRNAEAWHQLGSTLFWQGRGSEALAALGRALELDPQRAITLVVRSWVLMYQGRDADAERVLDSALSLDPESYFAYATRGWVRLRQGDRTGAQTDADAAVRLRPPGYTFDTEPLVVALLVSGGDTAAARAHAEQLAREVGEMGASGPISWSPASGAAMALAWVGDADRAMAFLERVRSGGVNTWWQMQDPAFAPLKSDPRYQRLLAELRPPWAR